MACMDPRGTVGSIYKGRVLYIGHSGLNLSTQHMKALGHMVSEKKIFFSSPAQVHRAIVVTSVVRVYVYVRVRITLSVKVFYKSISLDHVDGSS